MKNYGKRRVIGHSISHMGCRDEEKVFLDKSKIKKRLMEGGK